MAAPTTPVAYIDETGIHLPDFPTILTYFREAYRGIYGSDIYIENDSQDGQFLGLLAATINDANAMAAQVYNAYSPSTAQGTGLSSVVKINGIKRKIPSFSNAPVLVTGQAGTIVTNGLISGNTSDVQWALPAQVVIPYTGEILVTATCLTIGAIPAPEGSITTIVNTQPGWQTVFNTADATLGLPVENDPLLRRRQTVSTAIPSLGLLDGLRGALWEVSGVRDLRVYENVTNVPDASGIPGHCLAIVIDGGDIDAIGTIIQAKKGGGVGTYGNEIVSKTDAFGVPHDVGFFRPTDVPITWTVTLKSLGNFTTNIQTQIARALSDWTNTLGIGGNVYLRKGYVPANLRGSVGSETFDLLDLKLGRDRVPPGSSDVTIAFNERAFCDPSYVKFMFPGT